MAYVDQTRAPSAAGMAAVIGVHAGIAAILVAGLAVSGVIVPPDKPIVGIDLRDPPPPPPPPPPEVTEKPTVSPPETVPYVPNAAIELDPWSDPIEKTRVFPTPGPIILDPGPRLAPSPQPTIQPRLIDPLPARPRNDPARWLSDNDYRSSWVRQDLEGTARFRLDIAANGKVTRCTVTGSTGHEELDHATCDLVSRRAKFEPARGPQGEPVAGSFTSAVAWRLPE